MFANILRSLQFPKAAMRGRLSGALDSAGEKKIHAVLGKYLATEGKGLPW